MIEVILSKNNADNRLSENSAIGHIKTLIKLRFSLHNP